jgi:LuxR family maltose regulon positive regulatory protein
MEIARSHLMLVPLERNDERFRCHDLFRAMLRAELRQSAPRLVPRLHGRASVWLEQQGDLDGAIGHAVAAGDADRAGVLLWEHIADYLTQGRNETVQAWLDAFSPQQIAVSAPLALSAAHSCLMAGDPDQARHWGLLAADADQRDSATATRSLETAIALIDAAAPRRSVSEMAQAAERAYTLEPDHSPWRPMCCWLRGIAEHLAGRPLSAETWLEEGIALSAAEPSIASLCLGQLAVMAIGQDDWQTADEFAERAAEIATRPLLVASPMSALVFAVLAATRAQQGHVDDAKRDLRHGTDLLAELGDLIPWYAAETRLMLAQAAIRLADTVRARMLLAEASRLARRTPDAVIFKPCFDRAWAQIDTLAEAALSGPSSLTIAELRILRFLPSHRSFREIAERLDVSVNTVKTQAHAIYRKLDAASRSEAVARASSAGLLGT